MKQVVILDTSVLGVVSNPQQTPATQAARFWLAECLSAGVSIFIPAIADYELRRELLRLGKSRGLANLEALIASNTYLPLTTRAMRKAAHLWATARQQGQPTAADNTIDCDMILLAQALTCGETAFVIATTNVRHLARFAPADLWQNLV